MIRVKISFTDENAELMLDPQGSEQDAAKLEILLAHQRVIGLHKKDGGAWVLVFGDGRTKDPSAG
jgi:hypothetical protein